MVESDIVEVNFIFWVEQTLYFPLLVELGIDNIGLNCFLVIQNIKHLGVGVDLNVDWRVHSILNFNCLNLFKQMGLLVHLENKDPNICTKNHISFICYCLPYLWISLKTELFSILTYIYALETEFHEKTKLFSEVK